MNPETNDLQNIKVLIIEDDKQYARLLEKRLTSASGVSLGANFIITCVHELTEAFAVLGRDTVDLVLLDLNLPDSRGFETLSRLNNVAPNLPLVVLTGTDQHALQALQEGAQDYLVKGQEDSRLLPRVIRYAIERKKVEDHIRQRGQELEQRNRLLVKRELRMMELKKELEDLKRKAEESHE